MNSQQCSCLHKTCKDQTHQHTDVDWKKMSVGNVCWGTKNQFLVLFCFVFRDKTSGLKGQLIYICTYANTYKVIRLSRSYIHTHTHVVDLLKNLLIFGDLSPSSQRNTLRLFLLLNVWCSFGRLPSLYSLCPPVPCPISLSCRGIGRLAIY